MQGMERHEYLRFPPEAVHFDGHAFLRLPESARNVFLAVREEGPADHEDLQARTGLPARTVRFAVKRLRDEGWLDARSSLRDSRKCYFFIHRDHVSPQAIEAARRRAEAATGRTIERA